MDQIAKSHIDRPHVLSTIRPPSASLEETMQVSHAHPLAVFGLAALALSAGAQPNGRNGQLPQLSPATSAALVGSCESLAARLAGLPQTTITMPPRCPPAR
jgi:hypothetical protein